MSFISMVRQRTPMITEGAVYERMRRHPDIPLDPHVAHATLIYDPAAVHVLEAIHREYLDIGYRHRIPMVMLTDTWRASLERLRRSIYLDRDVNRDNTYFLRHLRASYGDYADMVFIGGDMGPKGDAYKPHTALARTAAEQYHSYQATALADAGVDFLFGATLPAFTEAHGMAHAMAQTGKPYVLSFVIHPRGTLLDGTSLRTAIEMIDQTVTPAPLGYSVNCVHPEVLTASLMAAGMSGTSTLNRLIIFQANTSALSPEQLDNSPHLHGEDPTVFAEHMANVRGQFGIPILGGCCGTDARHIAALAARMQ